MMLAVKGRAMPMADALTEGRRSDASNGGEVASSAHSSQQRSAPVLKLRPILGPRPDRGLARSEGSDAFGPDGGTPQAQNGARYRVRKAESRKRFTFRLPPDRHAAMMNAARDRGVSANALLTEALVPVLDEVAPEQAGPEQVAQSGGRGR